MTSRLRGCGNSLLLGVLLLAPRLAAQQTLDACSTVGLKASSHAAAMDLDSTEHRKSFEDAKVLCMSRAKGAIPAALLDEDKGVIDNAYPLIRNYYVNQKHTKEDVARIVGFAWTDFRRTNPSGHMTHAEFIQLSTSYGQLTINSDPLGASIAVDSKPWDEPTNVTDWTEAGERSVNLTKKGCKSETGKVFVPPGGNAKFERKLTCL